MNKECEFWVVALTKKPYPKRKCYTDRRQKAQKGLWESHTPTFLACKSTAATHSGVLFRELFTTGETGWKAMFSVGWISFRASWVETSPKSSHLETASSPSNMAGILASEVKTLVRRERMKVGSETLVESTNHPKEKLALPLCLTCWLLPCAPWPQLDRARNSTPEEPSYKVLWQWQGTVIMTGPTALQCTH